MIEVYTDGATKGAHGISGAGVYMKAYGKIYEYSLPLGLLTNHEAEFFAVMKALDICLDLYPNDILSFHSDSQLVVDAIEKEFVKNKKYRPLLVSILQKTAIFPLFFIKWIPNKQNGHADRLAKKAIMTANYDSR